MVSFAQEGTSSPYSFYGIGDVRFKGTIESRSMSGIQVEQDSIHLNLDNPASYSNLKLTTFTVGGTYNTTTLKNSSSSEQAKRTTFDYLAVGLPMGKLAVGFGLIPYSSVGYKVENISAVEGGQSSRDYATGGMTKAFFGASYKIAPKLSVGANVDYNFGRIETTNLQYINGVANGSRELNRADLSGVNFNFGAMYQTKLNKKLSLFSSLSYRLEGKLASSNTRNLAAVTFSTGFDFSAVQVADEETETENLTLPSELKFGLGIGEARKWLVGAQIVAASQGDLANTYNTSSRVSYEKAMRYSIGGYYIPNYNSQFGSYFKRIVYRAGIKYEETGLIVDAQSIKDAGVSFGLGLPVTGSFSNVNFGFEFGKRGTTSAGLIQENYAKFSIGLSLNDRWFVKRKYD
ncbi:membrane protein [Flavobacterium seoulense]|uniref:Membrane protein n=2 Tax=Flavobacterium seoulense TaxID=1492738 RepID=A0A066WLB1_9FLAO|nr:membrane protein [Flavobacterium seoulense]